MRRINCMSLTIKVTRLELIMASTESSKSCTRNASEAVWMHSNASSVNLLEATPHHCKIRKSLWSELPCNSPAKTGHQLTNEPLERSRWNEERRPSLVAPDFTQRSRSWPVSLLRSFIIIVFRRDRLLFWRRNRLLFGRRDRLLFGLRDRSGRYWSGATRFF